MTDQHPITPPPELLQQWATEYWGNSGESIGQGEKYIATQAARWGADQELKACIEVILSYPGFESPELFVEVLREARRPKPPSLAEEALNTLGKKLVRFADPEGYDTIRRALERLKELEKGNE